MAVRNTPPDENQNATLDPGKELEDIKAMLAQANAEKDAALKKAEEAEKARIAAEEAVKAAEEATAKAAEQDTLAYLHKQKKYVLVINSMGDQTAPVPLSFNGVAYLVKRDTEVLVPKGIINILNLSTTGEVVQTTEDGVTKTAFNRSKRFPYSYREATAEDESKLTGK